MKRDTYLWEWRIEGKKEDKRSQKNRRYGGKVEGEEAWVGEKEEDGIPCIVYITCKLLWRDQVSKWSIGSDDGDSDGC